MKVWIGCLLILSACAEAHTPDLQIDSTEESLSLPIGSHMPGVSDEEFAEARVTFEAVEGVGDGIGPVFNDLSCGGCHLDGAIGGAGARTVERFGVYGPNGFDPLASLGGSLRQNQTLGNWVNDQGIQCSVPLEQIPSQATKRAQRLTTPLFGLGLVDAMPDSWFVGLARSQPAATRGTVNWVTIELPDPKDPTQHPGGKRVGRFGWKAGVPSLVQFSADAYLNEMGITTQSCFKGASIDAFATESAPNGTPVVPECEDGLPGVDDAVGPCIDGLTEVQDDVLEFAKFMTFLAPPSAPKNCRGSELFRQVGCADCHTDRAFRTPRKPFNGVPGNITFYPLSDFLLHDMGSLGDQIGGMGDEYAKTRRMRTAPLWGLRFRTRLLHDGRTQDVGEAIAAHDGQGQSAANRFSRLNKMDRRQLLKYVESL